MKKQKEDNTVAIIQRAVRHFGISVTNGTVREALKSHPHYPSFKSICDSLSEWNVEHYPLYYQPEELRELNAPYIVHYKNGGGQLAFVSKISNSLVTFYENYKLKKESNFEDFIERCSGAVILINPNEKSFEKNYRRKWQDEFMSNSILPGAILILLFFISWAIINPFVVNGDSLQKILVLLLLTKTAGIALSVLLILHEFDVRIALTDKLCHLSKATNCNTVLNDKTSKIFGWFGWADAGFIYFSACLLSLLQYHGVEKYSILAILCALSVPYPVFSIYYQGFVLRKWCPICLGVQLILVIEYILLFPQFADLTFTFSSLSNLFLTFLIIGIVYTLVIMYIREKMTNEIQHNKYLVFKKNPEVLRSLLINQKHFDIPITETSLVFGEKDGKLKITAFLSLKCYHCARAFEKIKDILKSEANVAINIILMTSDSKVMNTLYHFNRANMEYDALTLLDQWYNMDSYLRNKVYESLCILEANDISIEVGYHNPLLNKSCNVLGTPTFFVNGYLLPNLNDIDDIIYFNEVFSTLDEGDVSGN